MDWFFPNNDGGEFHGIGDSGIDLFKGDPVKSLTREICQNSIDARIGDVEPVEVEFNLFEIPTENIPGYQDLLKTFEKVESFCKTQNFKKAIKYFDKSIPILRGESIPVLRISDKKTTGLPGASKADSVFTSPWYRLVRSSGSSDKADGSIGAFGSGSKSSFSCSDLQTIFYSTYVEGEGYAYQGVSKLICYIDEGHMKSDIGYYCEGKSLPIRSEFILDKDFKRKEAGTDVYIFGFKFSRQDWKQKLIVSVLDGFFYAIHAKNLIVKIGEETINSNNLGEYIEKYKEEIDPKTVDYYKIMRSEIEINYYSCLEENDVEIQMVIEPNMNKRVAVIRFPGMKIYDKGYISSTIPFAGICLIKGKKIAELLGGLENIQHNKWELSRYDDDPEKQEEARKQRDRITGYIKALFNKLRGDDSEGEVDPEVGDCLPDPLSEKDEKMDALSDDIVHIEKGKEIVIKPHDDTKIPSEFGEDDIEEGEEEGGEGGGSGEHPGPGPEPGPGPGPGPGPEPGPNPGPEPDDEHKKQSSIKYIKSEIFYKETDYKNGKYKIWLVPQSDIVDGYIELLMGAESDSYKAEIASADIDGSPCRISGSKIEGINCIKDTELEINIALKYSDVCSLEVKVYGH